MTGYRDKDDLGRPVTTRYDRRGENLSWSPRARTRRNRVILIFIALCIAAYLFLNSTFWQGNQFTIVDEDTIDVKTDPDDIYLGLNSAVAGTATDSTASFTTAPSVQATDDPNYSKYTYDSHALKFSTLQQSIRETLGVPQKLRKHPVMIIASRVDIASKLSGLACGLDYHKKVTVHMVLFGRSDVGIEHFKAANAIGDNCNVKIHDARPNMASTSTDYRMTRSAVTALYYIGRNLSPELIITDFEYESEWFKAAIEQSEVKAVPRISTSHSQTYKWMETLDIYSLRAWHKPLIDIVIQADSGSGQLIRLLKSIEQADYFHATKPRLHLILDPSTDPQVKSFVERFSWSSRASVFIQHKVATASSPEARMQSFVEGWFPKTKDSAVLFLDPNVEVAPYYFHWLYYAILVYKYSLEQDLDKSLVYGISLDTPTSFLNGKGGFPSSSFTRQTLDGERRSPFLYAAPSTKAALYFGQHWSLFHLYLLKRLLPKYADKIDYSLDVTPSKDYPLWSKYFTELMTAGGYTMLYPNFDPSEAIVTSHSDFSSARFSKDYKETRLMTSNTVLDQLPNGNLSNWRKLPVLDLAGQKTDFDGMLQSAKKYRDRIVPCYKKEPGGPDDVDDLFCETGDQMKKLKEQQKQMGGAKEGSARSIDTAERLLIDETIPHRAAAQSSKAAERKVETGPQLQSGKIDEEAAADAQKVLDRTKVNEKLDVKDDAESQKQAQKIETGTYESDGGI